eukprot:403335975
METTSDNIISVSSDPLRDFTEEMKQSLTLANNLIKSTPRELFSIAPMVDVSDRFFRYFMRYMTPNAFLYTEMLNEHAIIHNKHRDAILGYSGDNQHPMVCQIGGNSPQKMAQAARIIQDYGYDEVNINCGCPSSKTRDGCFGAVLMFDPKLVAEITREMMKSCSIPVTVKCRLGVDDLDKYEDVHKFIRIVSTEGGVNKFIIHARKCLLSGLSPHENRMVPELRYDWVLRLKQDFPDLRFVINGGFTDPQKIQDIMKEENGLEGVMVGRLAYNFPWALPVIDRQLFGHSTPTLTREEIILDYAEYAQREQDQGLDRGERIPNPLLVKPVINIFSGEYEGGKFRKCLSDNAIKKIYKGKVKEVLLETLEYYKEINPEGVATINGDKVIRPSYLTNIALQVQYQKQQQQLKEENQQQQQQD